MSRESTEELRQRLLRDERVRELISRRAYEIYVMRGGKPGGEGQDWFQAESEILSILIEEESRPADESTETDTDAASRPDEASGASPVGQSIGVPETADRLEQELGLTAEERADSQSTIAAWSPTEPPSEERAPVIGRAGESQAEMTEAKKSRSRPAAKPAAQPKSKPLTVKSAAAEEPAAKKTTAKRTASKKSADTPTKTTRSRKKSKE